MDLSPRSPNQFLASLPAADFELLRPHLRLVELVQENILIRTGDTLSRVYFPHSGMISLVVRLSEGEMVEVAMIGRDGVFGASTVHDGGISATDARSFNCRGPPPLSISHTFAKPRNRAYFSAPRLCGTNKSSLRKPSNSPLATPFIPSKPGCHGGCCECTICSTATCFR